MIERRKKLALRNTGKEEEHLEAYGGLREGKGIGLRENVETTIPFKGPGPARKKERGTPVVRMFFCGKTLESRTHTEGRK